MKRKLQLIIFLFCASISLHAQNQEGLQVISLLRIPHGNFDEANLTIKDNNNGQTKIIEGTMTGPNNHSSYRMNYNVILPLNQSFTLTFTKPNYKTKKLWFDTNIPPDVKKKSFEPIKFIMELIPQDSTEDSSFTQPIFKYQFSAKLNEFEIVKAQDIFDNSYYNNGVKKSQDGDYQGAINDFTEALKSNPKDIDALYNRAAMKFKLKDNEGACSDWNAIRALGKNDADELLSKYCANK